MNDELPSYLRRVEEVAADLGVDVENGLTSEEVERRLRAEGPNELGTTAPRPAWRRFLDHFLDPLVYLLLVAVVITLVVWALEGRIGWPVDAIVIMVIVVLNGFLGFFQESRSEKAAAALARATAVSSSVLRDGRVHRVPSSGLVRGDVLVMREGDSVGADARLQKATGLKVLEASLTGESEAVLKDPQTLSEVASLGDRRNMVFKGTAVAQGSGVAVVTATGMDTEIGSISRMLAETVQDPTPLQREIRHLGRMLGVAVLVIAFVVVVSVVMVFEVRTARDAVAVLLLGVSLAVAAVPEGLPAILSIVLAMGVQRMAKRHAIVKNLSSVETLGSASVICTDKTGTLTRSEMTIQRGSTASGATTMSGVGYEPHGTVEHRGGVLCCGPVHSEHIALLSGGSLAGNADLRQTASGIWEILGDPTEAAFLVAERKLGVHEKRRLRFERFAEIPFTSERKMMSILAVDHEQGDERVIIGKGAPDVLMPYCNRVRVGQDVLPLTDEARARAMADVEALSSAALRTLSVAYRPLESGEETKVSDALEHDLIFVGTVGIIDPPREEAAEAIREAQRAGIRIIMITGDHPRTAERIATDLGIIAAGAAALTGAEIEALDDFSLAETMRTTSVYARVAPAHKLRIVDALQGNGHVVAMTGDGVNDAPALKSADIGIAMGLTGTEVAKEAGNMILADDNFATIVAAVREGRVIFDNIRKFLRYLLSSNIGEILTVFLGVVGAHVIGLPVANHGLVLPLLATQILWINLVTDSGPALAMGMDPQSDDVMSRPPRRLGERVIDARMWSGVLQLGLVMAVSSILTLDLFLPGGLIEGHHSLETARTAAFTVLVLAQMFNAFNARSESSSAFRGLYCNHWLWGAVALSIALQVAAVHLPALNVAFSTVPLSALQWLLCVAIASCVLWYGEIRKLVPHNHRKRLAGASR